MPEPCAQFRKGATLYWLLEGTKEVQGRDLAPVFLKFLVRSVLGQNELNCLYHLELQTFATIMLHQEEKNIYALKIRKIMINNSNIISYVLREGR